MLPRCVCFSPLPRKGALGKELLMFRLGQLNPGHTQWIRYFQGSFIKCGEVLAFQGEAGYDFCVSLHYTEVWLFRNMPWQRPVTSSIFVSCFILSWIYLFSLLIIPMSKRINGKFLVFLLNLNGFHLLSELVWISCYSFPLFSYTDMDSIETSAPCWSYRNTDEEKTTFFFKWKLMEKILHALI